MTDEEKAICKKYSARDEEGKVHCKECPLVYDIMSYTCKATGEVIVIETGCIKAERLMNNEID